MDEIELSAEDKAMFLLRVARLNAYKQLAQVEEEEIKLLVQQLYKIDLTTNWTFDVEKGVLRRGPDQQQQQQQPEQSG